jgi:hypothetical protein
MALKLLVRSAIDIDGTAAELGLELPALGVLDELLLHAAMRRHAATGSAAMAPFRALMPALLVSGIIKPPRVFRGRLPPDPRALAVNVALTSDARREDTVNDVKP